MSNTDDNFSRAKEETADVELGAPQVPCEAPLMDMPTMSGLPQGMAPTVPNMYMAPAAPNMYAFNAYQPQYQLSYPPIAFEPNSNEQGILQNFEVHAQPVMLAGSDPNSPYYWDQNQQASARRMTIVASDEGTYQGEVDSDGKRINVGTCTWSDQSYYRGDWAQNVRHGNGVFVTADGIKFEGQWCNDVKHGMGILTYKDGEEITGFWSNDRLNGLAKVKKAGQKV